MGCIFILSGVIINQLSQVILIREMDADLQGIELKIKAYTHQTNTLPTGNPLDEERLSVVPTGETAVAPASSLIQLYSDREKKMHNFRQRVFPLQFSGQWYKVIIAKPIEGMHHLSRALLTISLTTILVMILITILLNNVVLRKLWKPFYASLESLRHFKLGKTNALQFPQTSVAEFSFLNETLRTAIEKAEQDYLVLKEFTENASHEMQTPLSIIRSKLDVLIQHTNLSEQHGDVLAEVYAAIKKLSMLNRSLLLLAKIENQQYNDVQLIDLKQAVTEKITQLRELCQSYQVELTANLEEATIHMNTVLLDILLNNLFSNAINHNSTPGAIHITLNKKQLSISNMSTGEALDEKRLFSRFYKASINSNSNGLGLSIIKQITKVSGVDIEYSYLNPVHSFILKW
jgi:signal transduction histidine kinase